jgi:hypothetical protein
MMLGVGGCMQNGIYFWLLGTFCLWFVLAIYFDNVLPDVNGVRKPWFYFLSISYWTGQETKKSEGGFVFACWVEYNQSSMYFSYHFVN